jgi:hypothetical protein
MSGVAELTFTFLFPERMGDNGHEHIPPPPLSIVGPALQEPVAAVAAVRGAAVRRVMPWYEQENIQKKIPDEVKFYFKIDSEGCDEGKKKLKLQCQVCAGVSRTLTLGNGWSNATSHLKDAHPDYFNVMKQCKGDKSLLSRFFCTKTQSVFGWIDLIVDLNLSFKIVTKKSARKHVKLESISRNTLIKYAEKLCRLTERQITLELPSRFGLIFDGWSEHGTHFVSMFARYLIEVKDAEKTSTWEAKEVLLACSPLFDEADLGADSHVQLIVNTLELYGKSVDNVLYITGDNVSTNYRISTELGVPLIGCYSHKFALGMKKYMIQYEKHIECIAQVMTKLRGVIRSAKLRERGAKKVPCLRNSTRWSSTFKMLDRFFYLLPFMDMTDGELLELLPFEHIDSLRALNDKLRELDEVTVFLQSKKLTLAEASDAFAETLISYPGKGFEKYLSPNATLIRYPVFEQAILKVMREEEAQLTQQEKESLRKFEVETKQAVEEVEDQQPRSIIRRVKRRRIVNSEGSNYISMNVVTPTSNSCERFFSQCGHVWSKQRKSMSPLHLEMILFLKVNRNFWDQNLVKMAIAESRITADAPEDDEETSDEEPRGPQGFQLDL